MCVCVCKVRCVWQDVKYLTCTAHTSCTHIPFKHIPMHTYFHIHISHSHIFPCTHISIYTYPIHTYSHAHIFPYTHIPFKHIPMHTYFHVHISHSHIFPGTHISMHTSPCTHLISHVEVSSCLVQLYHHIRVAIASGHMGCRLSCLHSNCN